MDPGDAAPLNPERRESKPSVDNSLREKLPQVKMIIVWKSEMK